jgi:HAD superfamily hydrolase (TIGR01509 family)
MPALLFGSIGTIADTSEVQRGAFNRAFNAHGLDWNWTRDTYVDLLVESGGQKRIAAYARSLGQEVDAAAIHRSKSQLFRERLAASHLDPRPGLLETMRDGKEAGFAVGFVTLTSRENVEALFEAMAPDVTPTAFDLVMDSASVERPKPDGAAYRFALDQLGEDPNDCIAIEDNLPGVDAATAAGLRCVAFPNENTAGHRFDSASRRIDHLDFRELRTLILSA